MAALTVEQIIDKIEDARDELLGRAWTAENRWTNWDGLVVDKGDVEEVFDTLLTEAKGTTP